MPYYIETEEKLKIRIRAHTEYVNFRLEDWLLAWLGDVSGCRLIEIGCGDGNFFPTYSKSLGTSGLIIGIDMNQDLLKRARLNVNSINTPTMLFAWDFNDHPYPLLDEEADLLIAPFSAYYTRDVSMWIKDSLRVMKRGGRMLLLGPTEDNAHELYELNKIVTGISSVPEIDDASVKLKMNFLPELKKILGNTVKETVLERQILFPSPEEFACYYFATWLYEKTQQKLRTPVNFEKVVKAAANTPLKLNKKVICIEAHKQEGDKNAKR